MFCPCDTFSVGIRFQLQTLRYPSFSFFCERAGGLTSLTMTTVDVILVNQTERKGRKSIANSKRHIVRCVGERLMRAPDGFGLLLMTTRNDSFDCLSCTSQWSNEISRTVFSVCATKSWPICDSTGLTERNMWKVFTGINLLSSLSRCTFSANRCWRIIILYFKLS